jgi:hypothetical protein
LREVSLGRAAKPLNVARPGAYGARSTQAIFAIIGDCFPPEILVRAVEADSSAESESGSRPHPLASRFCDP